MKIAKAVPFNPYETLAEELARTLARPNPEWDAAVQAEAGTRRGILDRIAVLETKLQELIADSKASGGVQ